VLAIVSGVGSACAQVLFTRALALTFHNSTYTFGAVVAAFLLSLAVGTAIAARTRGAVRAAAIASLVAAILLPGGVITLWASTQGLRYFSAFGDFAGYVVSAIGLALIVVAPAVTAMAMLLPLSWRLADEEDVGRTVGRLTAANNVAGAIGAIGAALVLVPMVGLWTSFAVVTAVYAITGAVLAVRAKVHRGIVVVAVLVAAIVAVVARPVPQPRKGDRLVTRWETRYGWLEVHEDVRGERRLRHNIHYGFASSDKDIAQRRMGQLPLLLHPAPHRALFIGLATGITAGGALADPRLERLDVVELIPEVLDAARAFAAWNNNILSDARAHLHVGDAHFWLRGADEQWDVIVTDLLKPWESQAGYLYTVEHYREVARHLAPGGIHVQWLALWQIAEADVALIADTTRAVFPTVVLVRGDTARRWGLLAIVASDRPIAIDGAAFARAAAALAPPQRHPDLLLATPRRLVELYIGDWPLRRGATLNRDDSLRLELDAPKRDRRSITLTGDRLVSIYRRVWLSLERKALTYTPAPTEPPWDPDYGLRQQMGAAGEDGTPPD
jgi:spermidine synthase